MKHHPRSLGGLCLLLLCMSAWSEALRVVRITPAGNLSSVTQQIVVEFDRPMVPLGNMDRTAAQVPVRVEPALDCAWRWLQPNSLACQLDSETRMRQATTYSVEVAAGTEALDGTTLRDTFRQQFTTLRPEVVDARFGWWLGPQSPLLWVRFNQPVTRASVQTALMLASEGKDYPAWAVSADVFGLPRWWTGDPAELAQHWRALLRNPEPPSSASDNWIVGVTGPLGAGAGVELILRAGRLRGAEGPEPNLSKGRYLQFETFGEFAVRALVCTPPGSQNSVASPIDGRKTPLCTPGNDIAIDFTSPVDSERVDAALRWDPQVARPDEVYGSGMWWMRQSHNAARRYTSALPGSPEPRSEYTLALAETLRDNFGRALAAPVEIAVRTSAREPALDLSHYAAVLEAGIDSVVPITATNLDALEFEGFRWTAAGEREAINVRLDARGPPDVTVLRPLGVRPLLDGASGVVATRITQQPKPQWHDYSPEIVAQVTPWQVQAKLGHFNSLVWVSAFADGEPVADASVRILRGHLDTLDFEVVGAVAVTDNDGVARLPGRRALDPELDFRGWGDAMLAVEVRKAGEMALLPLTGNWQQWVSGGGSWTRAAEDHWDAWATTAQGVYRQGENVQFKLYAREQANEGWVIPGSEARWKLEIRDPRDNVVHAASDFELSEFGGYDGEFKAPRNSPAGEYQIYIARAESFREVAPERIAGTFLVSDFTPAPFRVESSLNRSRAMPGVELAVESWARLFAGGPFAEAPVRLTGTINRQRFKSQLPAAAEFIFGAPPGRDDPSEVRILDLDAQLDRAGDHAHLLEVPEVPVPFGSLRIESAVRDDRGANIATSARIPYFATDRLAGVRLLDWLQTEGSPIDLELLVVSNEDEIIAGAALTVTLEQQVVRAARVRGAGNAWTTNNALHWEPVDQCSVSSGEDPVACVITPAASGIHRIIVTTDDTAGRTARTVVNTWVTGAGYVQWDDDNRNELELIPEDSELRVGDRARVLVKNPWPGVKALVTVERYGILAQWVETLESGTPVIEVPIEENYLPDVHVSVIAMSPRVAAPLEPGKLDLGKPATRIGYTRLDVVDDHRSLDVDVRVAGGRRDTAVYRPGDRVKATISVKRAAGGRRQPSEIAVAVIDQAVLALNREGMDYYDANTRFNELGALDVENFSLITNLIGRSKLGAKGANPGGGGGEFGTEVRDDIRFISYWNPNLVTNRRGRATIEFTVPDNLTGWEVIAMAVDRDGRMGLGSEMFRVNRDTQVRPVMPNRVLAGDAFTAGFSVMNRTDRARDVNVRVRVEGAEGVLFEDGVFEQTLRLSAGGRETLWLPVETRPGFIGKLRFTAEAGDRRDTDGIVHEVPVELAETREVIALMGSLADESIRVPVVVPEDVRPGSLHAELSLAPTLLGAQQGAFRYLDDYPHQCWEQRLSRAVAASTALELGPDRVGFDEAAALATVSEVLGELPNSQAPNGGFAYWVPRNDYVDPYLTAYTGLALTWIDANARISEGTRTALQNYLESLLRDESLIPDHYGRRMTATTRAVAMAALARSGVLATEDAERLRGHLSDLDPFGLAMYLQALAHLEEIPYELATASLDALYGAAHETSGRVQFDGAAYASPALLSSGARGTCAAVSALVALDWVATPQVSEEAAEKALRGALAYQRNGPAWGSTQDNAYCVRALADYAAAREAGDIRAEVSGVLFDQEMGTAAFEAFNDPIVESETELTAISAGAAGSLEIRSEGVGRVYYSTQLSWAQENPQATHAGLAVAREHSVWRDEQWVAVDADTELSRGERVRTDLFVTVPAARHYVAVTDPVPGAVEPINTQLATTSAVDANTAAADPPPSSRLHRDHWESFGDGYGNFYHREQTHRAVNFYADFLRPGNYHLSWVGQVIAAGSFAAPPANAEEMYSPDVFGRSGAGALRSVD